MIAADIFVSPPSKNHASAIAYLLFLVLDESWPFSLIVNLVKLISKILKYQPIL